MKYCLIILLIVAAMPARAGENDLAGMLNRLTGFFDTCTVDYTMKTIVKGQPDVVVSGRMANCKNQYYDSSNARFVFMNINWLIVADHQEKMVNAYYLPKVRDQLGSELELNMTQYLLSNNQYLHYSVFKVQEEIDRFVIHLEYALKESPLKRLNLELDKVSLQPIAYEGTLEYDYPSTNYNTNVSSTQQVITEFKCFNIHHSIQPGLFNEERLIGRNRQKAYLKRFQNYRIFSSLE